MTSRNVRRTPTRAAAARSTRKSGAGGTLLGLFIGIALGLLLAAGAAYYVMKAGNPYQPASPSKEPVRDSTRESGKTARVEPSAAEKPRFDFYKILPGIEEPKVPARSRTSVPPWRCLRGRPNPRSASGCRQVRSRRRLTPRP